MKAIKRTKTVEYVAVRMSVEQANLLNEVFQLALENDDITPWEHKRTEVIVDLKAELEEVLQ